MRVKQKKRDAIRMTAIDASNLNPLITTVVVGVVFCCGSWRSRSMAAAAAAGGWRREEERSTGIRRRKPFSPTPLDKVSSRDSSDALTRVRFMYIESSPLYNNVSLMLLLLSLSTDLFSSSDFGSE